jgi:hypothetical protein
MNTKKKRWVRCELRKPLQFDKMDVACSLFNDARISGVYLEKLKKNIDVSFTKVSKIPCESGKYSVEAFSFEGVETLSVNSPVKGEFDIIRETGWIKVRR